MTISEFKKDIKNKKVAVLGVGVSNLPLVRMLADCGADLCVYDKRTKEQLGEVYNELTALGADMVLGEHYLDEIREGTQTVFKTPVYAVMCLRLKRRRNRERKLLLKWSCFLKPVHAKSLP